eukprot:351471-Chlamydomonas_euryale.AAC.2
MHQLCAGGTDGHPAAGRRSWQQVFRSGTRAKRPVALAQPLFSAGSRDKGEKACRAGTAAFLCRDEGEKACRAGTAAFLCRCAALSQGLRVWCLGFRVYTSQGQCS